MDLRDLRLVVARPTLKLVFLKVSIDKCHVSKRQLMEADEEEEAKKRTRQVSLSRKCHRCAP